VLFRSISRDIFGRFPIVTQEIAMYPKKCDIAVLNLELSFELSF